MGKHQLPVRFLPERAPLKSEPFHHQPLGILDGGIDLLRRQTHKACGKLSEQLLEPQFLRQFFFQALFLCDVSADRHQLPRSGFFARKRDDCGRDPEMGAALRAVFDFAFPDVSRGERPPKSAHEFFRVMARVNDPMILAEQLLPRVLRDLAELIVDVDDPATAVGDRDDGMLVERRTQVSGFHWVPSSLVFRAAAAMVFQARIVHEFSRRKSCLCRRHPRCLRHAHQLRHGHHAHFFHHTSAMDLDRLLRGVELAADLFVEHSGDDTL
ncbi:MAG: hypothetical protein JWL90_1773 [Chthoniobacteraceae bacterium]|nr:hypothetical protein [Chthoniobacteraceae bacterium]